MDFCREFHMTPAEYLAQPADVTIQWQQMLAAEREGLELGKRIAQAQAKARSH